MKKLTILISLFTLTISTSTLACDCIMTPIETQIEETESIIVIQVVELLDTKKQRNEFYFQDQPNHSYRVKVRILNSYKGIFYKGEIIEIDSDFTISDIFYKDQEKYLLFLKQENNVYKIRHCSYSEKLENADEEISKIKNKLKK